MLRKKFKVLFLIIVSSIFLVACGSTSKGKDKNILTGQGNQEYYQGVIKNGKYLTSKSRGVDLQQNSNEFNLKGFEKGLLSISKQEFPTSKYIFQEGQYISTDTVEKWLGRFSKKDPEGLNPPSKKGKVVPIYLQQLEEQDYLSSEEDNNLKLKGMTIGLGINSVYYYKKNPDGPTYQKKISDEKIKSEGQKDADKVLKRLRNNKKLNNIPIIIALYKQAPNDSLVGGDFFEYSVNKGGSTNINKWESVNQKNYVFPIANGTKGPNSNDEAAFNEFKNQVQNFFPNLSGITAQAQYTNGKLSGMNVTITTQFYSLTEVINFTQYLQGAAQKYLPVGIPIDISVSSSQGIESFLSRGPNDKSFTFHIFNSY